MSPEDRLYALVLGALITARREQLDVAQKALADAADVSAATVSRIERGIVSTDANTLRRIANALNLDFAELVELTDRAVSQARELMNSLPAVSDRHDEASNAGWRAVLSSVVVVALAGIAAAAAAAILLEYLDAKEDGG